MSRDTQEKKIAGKTLLNVELQSIFQSVGTFCKGFPYKRTFFVISPHFLFDQRDIYIYIYIYISGKNSNPKECRYRLESLQITLTAYEKRCNFWLKCQNWVKSSSKWRTRSEYSKSGVKTEFTSFIWKLWRFFERFHCKSGLSLCI